ncbi:retropepsin-like aspartic protease [Lutibacter sp.]|uniref:retropepsin-like aspartic protease n=1 Tax=Lutibacter sp. TaxID=1925666 RepID=UPI0027369D81|nr:retropepsin-like aspartic protease [Lutibacter sp.]MDP3314401.1 retropepsin-like aspartic protease [Lutibacter sp.]
MYLNQILKRKGFVKIKLKRIETNHFVLGAIINGVKGRFIVDTGASNSCLDTQKSKKFKLEVKDSETKAAGAGAIGMETKIANRNLLEINEWTFNQFSIVLLDLNHVNAALIEHSSRTVHGIIGADILEKGEAIIDYKQQCLYLKKLVYKH